jgi:hypothetical protein
MATKLAYKTGNWTDDTIWGTATETGTATTTTSTAGTRYSSPFTAPSTSNFCLGGVVYPYAIINTSMGASSTYTLTLQEYNGSSWVNKSTATYTDADLRDYLQYPLATSTHAIVFMKFASPYQYTTTTAGYYRFSMARTSTTSSATFYAESGTVLWAMTVDDRNGAPTSSENAIIAGSVGSQITVTVDGAVTCGSNTGTDGTNYANASIITAPMSSKALTVAWLGKVNADLTQNTTLTLNGGLSVFNGEFHFGTLANPIPLNYTAKLILAPKTNYNLGSIINCYKLASDGTAPFSFVGQTKTYQTNYVSGTGTSASPLIVSNGTGWIVGDIIAFSGSIYSAREYRYIKTVNSSTSFILSSTLGGSEAALSSTHYNTDWALNLSRNSGISSGTDDKRWNMTCQCNGTDKFLMYYAMANNIGSATASNVAFNLALGARHGYTVEGCGFHSIGDTTTAVNGAAIYSVSTAQDNIFRNNVVYVTNSITYFLSLGLKVSDPTKVCNVYQIGGPSYGIYISGYGNNVDNFHIRNASTSYATSYTYAGFYLAGSNNTFSNFSANGCRCAGVTIVSGANNVKLKNSTFGTVNPNQSVGDICVSSAAGDFSIATFDSCLFTSITPVIFYTTDLYGYTLNTTGSKYSFQNFNSLTDNGVHYVNKPEGTLTRTAVGLADETIRTTGGSCYRFQSETSDANLEWSQDIPTGNIQNKTMLLGVWVKINSANYWAGINQMPRLTVNYDNGTTAYAEAGQTTDWQFIHIPITPTTTFPQITLTCSTKTDATTIDAYVYFTDLAVLYPAGYQLELGTLSNFAFGEPLMPTIATNVSAADVWAYDPDSVASGTIGEEINIIKDKTSKGLTTGEFIALKDG